VLAAAISDCGGFPAFFEVGTEGSICTVILLKDSNPFTNQVVQTLNALPSVAFSASSWLHKIAARELLGLGHDSLTGPAGIVETLASLSL
jgi:hypothetical protein